MSLSVFIVDLSALPFVSLIFFQNIRWNDDDFTKFNRFVLGSSFELDPKSKIFVQIENETIRTKVGDSAAFSLLSVSVSGSTASALDFTSSTFYSILSNSSSQSLTLNGLKVGYSFSF